jgi:hypothetical protein
MICTLDGIAFCAAVHACMADGLNFGCNVFKLVNDLVSMIFYIVRYVGRPELIVGDLKLDKVYNKKNRRKALLLLGEIDYYRRPHAGR